MTLGWGGLVLLLQPVACMDGLAFRWAYCWVQSVCRTDTKVATCRHSSVYMQLAVVHAELAGYRCT